MGNVKENEIEVIETSEIILELKRARQEVVNARDELMRGREELAKAIEITNSLKRIVGLQRDTITKLTTANSVNNAELQGTKVCLSILIQREGGEIVIPDGEMQDHSFKLEVSYNLATLSTVLKSHVKEVTKTPQ